MGSSKKKININNLRVIKNFSNKNSLFKINDYEKFLCNHVSLPTARKIIKDLIELKIAIVKQSDNDLRVKFIQINDSNIDKYL